MYILPKELPRNIDSGKRTKMYELVGQWRRNDNMDALFWHYREVVQFLKAGDADYERTLASAPQLFDLHKGRETWVLINGDKVTRKMAIDRLSFLYSWKIERVAYLNFIEYVKTQLNVL